MRRLQADTDEAHVIGRLLAVYMSIDQLTDEFANGVRSFCLTGLYFFNEAMNSELITLFVHRFIDPVRVKNQDILGHQGEVQRLVLFS